MLKNKKIFVLLALVFAMVMSITSLAAATEVIYGPANNETPYKIAGPDVATSIEYGQKFTFDSGKEMTKLTLSSMPTWGPRAEGVPEDNYAKVSVYTWNTDYATSVAGTAIKVVEINDHKDGEKVEITFDKALASGTYLWVVSDATAGVGGLGFWGGAFTSDKCKAFVNGTEDNAFFARVALTLQEANASTGDTAVFAVFVVMIALAAVVAKKKAFN